MPILDIISNPSLVQRLRLIVYAVLVFFSFFIFIGVSLMKNDKVFKDVCPLYCDGKRVGNQYIIDLSTCGNCAFPLTIAVLFQLLFLLFRITTLLLLALGKLSSDFFLFSNVFELVYVGVDLIGFFFTFIGACILSAGTNHTCVSEFDCTRLDFYSSSKAAQAGAWISTFVWLFISLVGILHLLKTGKIPFLNKGASGAGQSANTATATTDPDPYMETATPPSNYI